MKKIVFFIGFVIMFMTVSAQWSGNSKDNTRYSKAGELGNTQVKVAKTSDGMMYMSYTSGGLKFNTRLQLIDKDGNAMWPDGGIVVSDHKSATWVTGYTLCVTSDDCALITFSDSRGSAEKNIFQPYVYKINKEGEFVWGIDGVKIPYDGIAGYRPRMCVTNSGNTIVTFTDKESSRSLLCKISPEGNIVWGKLEIEGGDMANVVPSGKDGFIVTYYTTKGVMLKLNAQKYNGNGEPVWGEPVTLASGGMFNYNEPQVLSDGEDGMLILFDFAISNAEIYNILQRVSLDGVLMMGLNGVKVSNYYELHAGAIFDVDIERGEIFAFEMCYSMPKERYLRVNKFNMFGETAWSPEGITFVDKIDWGYLVIGVNHTGDGGAILTYMTSNTNVMKEVWGSKIETDGTFRWKNVHICDAESSKLKAACSPVFNDQVCVFWCDGREGNLDLYGHIYGQNISLDGKLGVISVGVEDATSAEASTVSVYPNPANNFIAVKSTTTFIDNITITDISGRVVLKASSSFDNIDIRPLKSGVYVVNTATTEGDFVNKVVIK